ncbi:MAG: MFS transporter [Nanoarchaeota archaeon]
MSLLNNSHIHHFFRNKEMNQFYIAIAIMSFGEALISIFVPIYFFKLGYNIPEIIGFYFINSLSFVLLSFFGAKIVSKIGINHSILASIPFLIAYYIGLKFISSQPTLFFILPIILAINMIFYNYGYHLNFVTNANKKEIGKEMSFMRAASMVMYTIAPFIGGILAYYNFALLYLAGSIIVILAAIPLIMTKDKSKRLRFSSKDIFKSIFSKKDKGTILSFAGYAIESIIGRIIWPIFLIIILFTTEKTGFTIMLSTLLSIMVFYLIGYLTDTYNKMKLLKIGTLLYSIGWLIRIFADSFYKIIIVDSYKNITEKILGIPWGAHCYELADKKGQFRFIVTREIVFNLTRVFFLPILIAVFIFTKNPFVYSFGIAAVASLGYAMIDKK